MQTYFPLQITGVNISKLHHSNRLKVYLCLHLYCCAPPGATTSSLLTNTPPVWVNILYGHPLIRLKVYLCLHILLFTSRTYYVLTQTYSPWKPTGVNVLHPDTLIIQLATSVFSSSRAPCSPPCSHQYSSLKGVRVNTLHSLSFDFTHRLPLLSCLVVHPEDL